MIRSLWVAKTGLDAQQTQLDVISHNLANISTTGYKRSRAVFEDLLYQTTLDVAINGQGFFQIQMPDGTLAYTRDGSFQKDNTGQVVTSSGYPVSPALTIPQDALTVTISRDGVVSVTQPGSTAVNQIGTIQIANFINPGGLQSAGENLFVETASSGTPTPNTPGTNGTGLLNQTYVETSNVNAAEELVTMIQTQRAYEMNSKVITTSDQMLAKLASL